MEARKISEPSKGRMVRFTYPENEDASITMERIRNNRNSESHWPLHFGRILYNADSYEDAQRWLAEKNNDGPSNQENTKRNDSQTKIMKKSSENRVLGKKENTRELRVVLERIPDDKLLELTSRGASKTTTTNSTTSTERDERSEEGCDEERGVVPIFDIRGEIVGFCINDSPVATETSEQQFQRVPSPVTVSADLFQTRPTSAVNETEVPGPSQSSRIPQVPQSSREIPGLTVSPDLANDMLLQRQLHLMNGFRNHQRSPIPHIEHQMSALGPTGPFCPQPVRYEPSPLDEMCQFPSVCPRHQPSVSQPPLLQHNAYLSQQNQNPFQNFRAAYEYAPTSQLPCQPAENLEEEDQEDTETQQLLRYAHAIDSETHSISQNLDNVLQNILELRNRQSHMRKLYVNLIKLVHARRRH